MNKNRPAENDIIMSCSPGISSTGLKIDLYQTNLKLGPTRVAKRGNAKFACVLRSDFK